MSWLAAGGRVQHFSVVLVKVTLDCQSNKVKMNRPTVLTMTGRSAVSAILKHWGFVKWH